MKSTLHVICNVPAFAALKHALSSCSSRGCSLGGFVVLGERNKLPSSDMGVRDPLLPSGTPPPLGIGLPSPKMRDLLFHFTQNFGDRTHITKRIPVLTEHPSRGEEGDSTRTEPVSIEFSVRLARSRGAPRRSSGGCTACERLAERRVRPSSKMYMSCSKTL